MKKKKQYDDDNNMTIAEMNLEGMPWYQSKKQKERHKEITALQITKKERKAIVKGVFKAYLPVLLISIGSFCLVFGLLYLWLCLNS